VWRGDAHAHPPWPGAGVDSSEHAHGALVWSGVQITGWAGGVSEEQGKWHGSETPHLCCGGCVPSQSRRGRGALRTGCGWLMRAAAPRPGELMGNWEVRANRPIATARSQARTPVAALARSPWPPPPTRDRHATWFRPRPIPGQLHVVRSRCASADDHASGESPAVPILPPPAASSVLPPDRMVPRGLCATGRQALLDLRCCWLAAACCDQPFPGLHQPSQRPA
jgi:hypothetical protein